ncbi:MAG: Ig-like domain-containing protein, partial [Firmicutes bacterium]|nr:Ig-like domain-containing protein [Bacillota bacterium]
NNKEGASVNVRNVKLYYANRPIPGEDQNFTAENIASFAPGDSPATVELFGRSAIMPSNAGSSWGGLMSPSFNLNLDRNPQVNIDVEDIAPGGTFTLYFTIGGVNYYVYANQTGKGPQTADIKSWILRYQPGAVLSGALPTNVHIWATDKVGGWLIVNSISVTYPDTGQTVFSADKAAIERFGTSTVGPGKIGVVDAAARVTEANPGGDYGEVKSMEFFLDFDQNVTFSIDVAAVSNFWTARVQFDGEAYPSYMIANSRATGVTAVNMAEALGQYNAGFSKTGVQKVTLFLMANGGEGASVDVRGVTIKHTPKIPVIVEDAYFTAQQIAAFPAFDGVNGSAALSGGAAVVSSGARYYGGVVSPSFQIDFNRDPVLSIDVSDVSGMYFIQVQFSDQAYAYYTSLLNMTAPGPRTVDLRDSINALQAGAVDDGTGIKTVKVNIVAMNGDGSTGYNTVSVKSLSVTHGAAGEIPVQGISFDNPGADLRIGGQLPISVAYEPKMTTQRALDWSSSDEAVATVSSDGVVTAVGEGFAAIRAVSAVNPAISAVCAVSVSAGPLLTADYPAPCHTGSTYPINAVYQAAGSGFLPMAYASSAPDVVSVDSGGNMTVLKQGTAIVTITGICPTIEGKVSYSMTVSAESPLYGLIARVEEMFANNGLDANTAASVAALREALDAAKAVAGGEAVLQEDLDAAYNALSAALEGLRQASFNCGVKSMLAKIAKLQKIPFEWDGYGAALFATSNAAVCGVTPDGRLVPLKAGIAVITVTAPNGAKVLFAVTVTA